MTALRTTEPIVPRKTRMITYAWIVVVVGFGCFGCGHSAPPADDSGATATTVGINDPAWLTSREKLPPPDADRIEYDAEKRILRLYDLQGQDRWMVQLPNEQLGRQVGPEHRLPEGVDTKHTLVYYVRPGVKVSTPVTVAAISGRTDNSLALNH
jgi:hypothetical protein